MNIVLLAGGFGTRLWPISRALRPKQFINLHDENRTLLQETILRLDNLKLDSLKVICNEEHRFFVSEQLDEINAKGQIILEPESRNTAPAIAISALLMEEDDLLLVLPADHVISDEFIFTECIEKAKKKAEQGYLVTFGVVPTSPHTGYGYIKKGSCLDEAFTIESFHEKPKENLAKEFFKSEEFLWNSGMFLFKAGTYLSELKKTYPEIYENCKKSIEGKYQENNFLKIETNSFLSCPKISIDYAVMERTDLGIVFPLETNWNDIGSWEALWEVDKKDDCLNSIRGDVYLNNVKDSFVRGNERLIVLNSISNLVVIDTKDSLLISDKKNASEVTSLLEEMKEEGRSEVQLDREVYRPWGKYDSIDSGNSHQVKRITVKPGEKLSLQSHKHRSEHWVVVSGKAEVTKDSKIFNLLVNESIYIPVGSIHSLRNPSDEDLIIIEVQCGDYLGEDDIKRYEDIYGRVNTD